MCGAGAGVPAVSPASSCCTIASPPAPPLPLPQQLPPLPPPLPPPFQKMRVLGRSLCGQASTAVSRPASTWCPYHATGMALCLVPPYSPAMSSPRSPDFWSRPPPCPPTHPPLQSAAQPAGSGRLRLRSPWRAGRPLPSRALPPGGTPCRGCGTGGSGAVWAVAAGKGSGEVGQSAAAGCQWAGSGERRCPLFLWLRLSPPPRTPASHSQDFRVGPQVADGAVDAQRAGHHHHSHQRVPAPGRAAQGARAAGVGGSGERWRWAVAVVVASPPQQRASDGLPPALTSRA